MKAICKFADGFFIYISYIWIYKDDESSHISMLWASLEK